MADAPRRIRLTQQRRAAGLDIRVQGQRRVPLEDLYHLILIRTWWHFFIFVAVIFLALNTLFGFLYTLDPGCIANARPGSFEDAFFFSVQTIGTIGYGGMAPANRYGHVIVTIEALVGIMTTALATGITFSKFARPTSRVLFAEKAVVCPRDGVPHLIFRMANWRRNSVVDAQIRVVLLVNERTREGEGCGVKSTCRSSAITR